MIFLVYMLIDRRYHLLQPGFKLIFTKTETAYTHCLSQFRKRRQSVKTQASDCIHLFPLSPTPTGLLPALCVLFTWLTCSVHAGSFVHQKAPAPGDCLLTFLSRALQMSVSSLFLSPPFCYFSTLMKCLPGWRLPVQTSGWLVIPRQACLIKSHWISSLHYVYHIWRRYFVETHASVCKLGIQSCSRTLQNVQVLIDTLPAIAGADPVNFQVQSASEIKLILNSVDHAGSTK